MYDTTIGRFFSADPIGLDGGDPNFYRYVTNDPTNLADPSGLKTWWTWGPWGWQGNTELGTGEINSAPSRDGRCQAMDSDDIFNQKKCLKSGYAPCASDPSTSCLESFKTLDDVTEEMAKYVIRELAINFIVGATAAAAGPLFIKFCAKTAKFTIKIGSAVFETTADKISQFVNSVRKDPAAKAEARKLADALEKELKARNYKCPVDNNRGSASNSGAAANTLGLAREQYVAKLVGGKVSRQKVIAKGFGSTDIDVIGPNGEWIGVGGPAKAADLSGFGRQLQNLSEAAKQAGKTAKMYLDESTPQAAIDLAKRWLGDANVVLFKMCN